MVIEMVNTHGWQPYIPVSVTVFQYKQCQLALVIDRKLSDLETKRQYAPGDNSNPNSIINIHHFKPQQFSVHTERSATR